MEPCVTKSDRLRPNSKCCGSFHRLEISLCRNPQETLAAAIRFFFDTALPTATGKRWADLHDAKCHLGAYAAYSGEAVPTAFGQSITPKYVLKVSKRELPVAASGPDSRGATVGTDVQARHFLWLRHAADVKTDTADEIARVMADLDSFAHLFEAPAGGAAARLPVKAASRPGGPL